MSDTAITINVTQADIDAGRRGHCSSCPISHAIRRRLGLPSTTDIFDMRFIRVYYASILAGVRRDASFRRGNAYEIPTPIEAQRFMSAFDARREVSPFTFELFIPSDLAANARRWFGV